MTRRAIVVVVTLASLIAGCSGGAVARRPLVDRSAHRAQPASRFELYDKALLHGQPQGFAIDREGAIVEIGEVKVVALDRQGAEQWSTPVPGAAYGWPWFGAGVVVVPTLSTTNRDTGESSGGGCATLDRHAGTVRWSYEEDDHDGVAVAGAGDVVYCVFRDGTSVAIDLDTGHLVWRSELVPGEPEESFSVPERTAIVIDPGWQALVFSVRWRGQWMLVRHARGEDLGVLKTTSAPSAPVLVSPGRVAFGGAGGVGVWDMAAKAAKVVEVAALDDVDPTSIPVVADGVVIVVAGNGSVAAVDLDHAKVRWTTKLDTVFLDAKPVVADGVVVVADGTRTTWALRVPDGSKVDVPSVDGFVVGTAADPGGGVAVAVRAQLWGEVQRWRPSR